MQVKVSKGQGSTWIARDQNLEDWVPEHDRVEARYNLETYGRYWAYPLGELAALLMREQ